MSPSNDPLGALRSILREIATEDVGELILEARRDARLRARRLIEDALVEELLHAAAIRRRSSPTAVPGATSSKAAPEDVKRPTAARRPTPVQRPTAATAERRSRAAGDARPGESVWWAYCVLSAEDAASLALQTEGIEPGSAIEVVVERGLAALVSRVPAAEYNDESLREHLEDLEWVERTARAHEAVLEEALHSHTIVPLRLCTIYRDIDGPHRLLLENDQALTEALARVAGCREWGVKVFVDLEAFESATALEDEELTPSGGESAASGAAYLARRQRERSVAGRASELRAQCAEAVHSHVSRLAREAKSNPVQRPEVHGRELTMLLNGAYLLERERVSALEETVDDLKGRWQPSGFVIELTGPWPAYNFTSGAAGVMP